MEQNKSANPAQHAEQNRPAQIKTAGDVVEFDLVELFFRLLAAWKMVIAFVALGMVAAFAYTQFWITPLYRASSTIYVVNRKDSMINVSDLQIGTALTKDYIELFNTWELQEEVIEELGLPYSYSYMRSRLSVSNAESTRMITISFTSTDPVEAANVANAYARISRDFISEVMSTDKPNVVSTALVPTSPVNLNVTRTVALGFAAGLAAAAAIVVIQMLLDDKVKTTEDIRRYTGLVNLAIVPIEEGPASGRNTRHTSRSNGTKSSSSSGGKASK